MIAPMRDRAEIEDRLKQAGLRPTRQRVCLVETLFQEAHRHVTAEQLHNELVASGLPMSLATVYNTLHQLTRIGLLTQVVIEPGQSYFDTNSDAHHHFYHVDSGRLEDIHGHGIEVIGLPDVPAGATVSSIQVVVRVRGTPVRGTPVRGTPVRGTSQTTGDS